MAETGKEHSVLLDAASATGCVLSFLADAMDRNVSGVTIKRMSGELHRILQLLHPLAGNSAMDRMAKGLRHRFPVANRVRDAIWDIDVLLAHLQRAYPSNKALSREELLHKTMMLFMIFTASRPVELTRMETPDPKDVGADQALLRAIPKQRGGERTSVIVRRVSITSLCPLEALKEWLLRRHDDASPHLFTREVGRSAAVCHRKASACAPCGSSATKGQRGPQGRRGNTSSRHLTTPAAADTPTAFVDLTTNYIRAAFKSIMVAAGVPPHYTPYSIRHAVVTALFRRGASDEEVVAYGRWTPGSRVPRLFYFIHATDGTWIGEKLLEDQPSLQDEATLQNALEESERAEVGDEQPETDSSETGESDKRADR
jgi:integrase